MPEVPIIDYDLMMDAFFRALEKFALEHNIWSTQFFD